MTPVKLIENADAAAIAEWLAQHLTAALASAKGPIAIAIPGGSTPFPILAELQAYTLDWSRITVWPTDDRVVPEEHAASNVGRIRALLEPLGAHITALAPGAAPPHFALVWLGMGEDGHIASLFPNTDPHADDIVPVRRLTPDPLPPEAPFDRFSLTIPALCDCDAVLFVIRGEAKAALFAAAVQGLNDLPVARLLAAVRAPVTCFT